MQRDHTRAELAFPELCCRNTGCNILNARRVLKNRFEKKRVLTRRRCRDSSVSSSRPEKQMERRVSDYSSDWGFLLT